MHELGLNLEFQGCHWKNEMKSLENDIKIIGIGVTVWKWQAIQKLTPVCDLQQVGV